MGSDGDLTIIAHRDDWREVAHHALPLCRAILPEVPENFLLGRLPLVSGLHLLVAHRNGEPIGFKLAYAREPSTLFSWLGGVVEGARRSGVARMMMERQHGDATALGYGYVATRTRAENRPMLILNLTSGFEVSGFEVEQDGRRLVNLRKVLSHDTEEG